MRKPQTAIPSTAVSNEAQSAQKRATTGSPFLCMNELSQPFEFLKVVIQEATQRDDDNHNNEVSVFPMQLWHKIKVHSINASDGRWYR